MNSIPLGRAEAGDGIGGTPAAATACLDTRASGALGMTMVISTWEKPRGAGTAATSTAIARTSAPFGTNTHPGPEM